MAYKNFDGMSDATGAQPQHVLQVDGDTVQLPDASYVRDAAIGRDGMDLTLDSPHGTITVEGYFAAAEAPDLVAPDGSTLTPELVNSFARSSSHYAQNASMSDASPVGAVDEVSGEATITRLDGSVEHITIGTEVYQGDVIETSDGGAVNIVFSDETSFAVSEDARLAIDEYVYDPATESGAQNFSVLKGVFVFTSGLIGRDDPDDVHIATPSGSIGIRGTVIAGNVDTGEITVVEGAIVLRNFNGEEMTLASQFETGKFLPGGGGIEHLGQLAANDVSDRFVSVSKVAPTLFSSVNDAATEQSLDAKPAVEPDANGSVDQDGDNQVDGTVEDAAPADAPVENTAPVEGEKTGEVQAPKPAPLQTTTQFGMDPMGGHQTGITNHGGPTLHMAGTSGLTAPTTLGLHANLAGTAPLQPVDQPLNQPIQTQTQDPRTLQTTAPTVDLRPVHIRGSAVESQHSIAPEKFFQVGEQQSWDYHFDKEFLSTPGDDLTFELSSATMNLLDATTGITSWTFDESNGHLTINTGTLASNLNFNIEVLARDAAGQINPGGFQSYGFTVFNAQNLGLVPSIVDDSIFADYGDDNAYSTDIGSGGSVDNVHIFAGGGNDSISLTEATNSTINLGGGTNSASIASDSTNNTVIGGFNEDTVSIGNAHNKVYGMDGDDKFIINLTSTPLIASLQTFGQTGILIDGGHSNFRHTGHGDGRGDTLALDGNGTIDFRAIDNNYIRGIERIDVSGAGSATVHLNYNDVLEMTDFKNTLVLRAGSGDTLNFHGTEFSNFVKSDDDVVLDDGYAGASDPVTFDVYTDGNVTLLVQDTGATVTGLPS